MFYNLPDKISKWFTVNRLQQTGSMGRKAKILQSKFLSGQNDAQNADVRDFVAI